MRSSRPAAALVLAALLLTACGEPVRQRARHLVFITVDTLRADRLGCYGGPNRPSPTIDALAAQGVRFANAYVPRAVTLPSMTSYFTSRYPDEHGVLDNQHVIPPAEVMLAERLEAQGFRCRGYNASGVLGPYRTGIDQGFKKYQVIQDEVLMTRVAAQFLRGAFARSGQREFVWVHYMRPHKPYLPPPPYDTRFDPDYKGAYDGTSDTLDRIYVDKERLAPADRAHIEAVYDGTIAFVDDCIKELLAALRDSGAADDTLVVFAADHGEDLYSHNAYYYHANSLYRSCTHVPLVFHQPSALAPAVIDRGIAESLDFAPTVLAWLGLPPHGGAGAAEPVTHGTDLGPVLRGEDTLHRDFTVAQWEDRIYAIRNESWMLVSNPDDVMPDGPPKAGAYPIARLELYDVKTDPDEQHNVVAEHQDLAERMLRALDLHRRGLMKGHAEQDLSDERRRDLEQTGYLERLRSPGAARDK